MSTLFSAAPFILAAIVIIVMFWMHRSNSKVATGLASALRAHMQLVESKIAAAASSTEANAKTHVDAQLKKWRTEAADFFATKPAAPAATAVADPPPVAAQPTAGASGPTVVNDGHTLTITTQAPYVPNPASNTPDWRKSTDTSPAGYPMIYQLNADGTVALDASSHPIAQVQFDGKLFADDAAVALYRAGQASKAA